MGYYTILVTGSRYWSNVDAIEIPLRTAAAVIESLGLFPMLIHGGCPTGADAIADNVWKRMGYEPVKFPADWKKFGKAAGPIRNKQMVDTGPDICFAFPIGDSYGTRGCMQLAVDAGIKVVDYSAIRYS